jgi:hypothetical protein
MKSLLATAKLLPIVFMIGLSAFIYQTQTHSASKPPNSSSRSAVSVKAAVPANKNGVDGNIYDQYPNFVPLPRLIKPRKGELPPQYRVSVASPFITNCEGITQTGTVFTNAEVEPSIAVNPANSDNFIGNWQQDRWSNGAARGLASGISFDGGKTWSQRLVPFSRCSGGTVFNGGNYERATDPWVTFSPNGTAHQMALALNNVSNTRNAMLASRSTDGGNTWSNPATLILDIDGDAFFNDKNAITADPGVSNFVYAVWDRLAANGNGPTYFARTIDGGNSWQTATPIYNPGGINQTIGNIIVVLPDGTLINLFTQIDTNVISGAQSAFLAIIRSTDKGQSWSQPWVISDFQGIGTRDPETGAAVRDGSIIPQIAVSPDGALYVVWQDSRFSGGLHDSIALSRSIDGGFTWSTPVRVNPNINKPAFTPTVHVKPDGVIGVSYYDLRSNTADPNTLLADYWLARSVDGTTWEESRITEPFDLATAPNARGYFLGDYQGLVSAKNVFIPFFVKTNGGDFSNRTDVFVAPAIFKPISKLFIASSATAKNSPQIKWRVHENITRVKQQRRIERRGLPGPRQARLSRNHE